MNTRTMDIPRTLVRSALAVAIVSALAAIAAGPGYQTGLWNYRTGFAILRGSGYIAGGAALVALLGSALSLGARRYRLVWTGIAAAAIALAPVAPGWQLQRIASRVPRIHDITTDTEDPPQFVALRSVRESSPNGAAYGGEKIAREQRAAYPDIQPVIVSAAPEAAFDRALAAARAMGWDIAAAAHSERRIEATATTRWFRFKDDIVIRVTPQPAGSRIDVRSVSRLGRSDLGTNAKRIRNYVRMLTEAH